MLQRNTVSSELLGVLETLMSIPALKDLRLVGGTSLALQIGHRHSVDIDLFGTHELDGQDFYQAFSTFNEVRQLHKTKSINIFLIEGVKVDIVNYRYPWLDSEYEVEGIRMASLRDIAAMKISAITQRGSKKDFIDLHLLLMHFTMSQMMSFYREKITDGNEWLALRSLAFFEDADQQPMPRMFSATSWDEIKASIIAEVKKYSDL